jgi:hypothetical protein
MTTIDTPTKEIERTYEVALQPLSGRINPEEPYEPRRVRLRYPLEQADDLDPRSGDAFLEAFKRAVRLEAKEFECDPVAEVVKEQGIDAAMTMFIPHIRYVSGSLVDYLPRQRPKRSRR